MSIQSRREEEKQARVEMIKKSAWNIFLKESFDKAKIADIAKDCRLGLSTLYYYFKDKRQIVYSLMLDFKLDNNEMLNSLLKKNITYRKFLEGYIDAHLQDVERFRFFVLADNYYNYNKQYDLSDPVLEKYDKITRKNGDHLLKCLSGQLDTKGEARIRVAISMMLGSLRRHVLLPSESWPKPGKETNEMIKNLKDISFLMFQDIGIDLDSSIIVLQGDDNTK